MDQNGNFSYRENRNCRLKEKKKNRSLRFLPLSMLRWHGCMRKGLLCGRESGGVDPSSLCNWSVGLVSLQYRASYSFLVVFILSSPTRSTRRALSQSPISVFAVASFSLQGRANPHFALSLFLVPSLSSLVYVLTRSSAIFFGVYTVMMLSFTALSFRALRHHAAMPWRLVSVSFWSYLVGFILWNIENNFCSTVRGVRTSFGPGVGVATQLHAWWHFLAAIGGYWCVVFLVQLRMVATNQPHKVVFHWEIFPVVEKTGSLLPVETV